MNIKGLLFVFAVLALLAVAQADAIAAEPANISVRAVPARPPNKPPKQPPNGDPPVLGPAEPQGAPRPANEIQVPDELPSLYDEAGDSSAFKLGSYQNTADDDTQLFLNLDGTDRAFWSKLDDLFALENTYLPSDDPYSAATGSENPYDEGKPTPTGQPLKFTATLAENHLSIVTHSFDPKKVEDVCKAWRSLATYCSGSAQDCACASGSYYVPDMWNSLAAGCAVATKSCGDDDSASLCSIGKVAKSYTDYCTPASNAVKFAEVANIKSASQDDPDPTPAAEAETTSGDAAAGTVQTSQGVQPSGTGYVIVPTATSTGASYSSTGSGSGSQPDLASGSSSLAHLFGVWKSLRIALPIVLLFGI